MSSATWQVVNDNIAVQTTSVPPAFVKYQTSDTVAKSGILPGANRVTSLTLKQVRNFDAAGNQDTEASQQLYPLPSP